VISADLEQLSVPAVGADPELRRASTCVQFVRDRERVVARSPGLSCREGPTSRANRQLGGKVNARAAIRWNWDACERLDTPGGSWKIPLTGEAELTR